jgi:FdhD protein
MEIRSTPPVPRKLRRSGTLVRARPTESAAELAAPRPGRNGSEDAHSETLVTQIWQCTSEQGLTSRDDTLAREEPLEIRIHGRRIAVTMRTPGHDAELTAGFLLSEGIIRSGEDLAEIVHCRQAAVAHAHNIVNVFLRPNVEVDFEKLTRHVYASSSCGLCGKASIEAVQQHFPPITPSARVKVSSDVLLKLPARLRTAQKTFDQTGALHAAAIFDLKGRLLVCREDVGRHNAVDKVIGYGLMRRRLPFAAHILLVSGRASFEILQKALAARTPIVAAVSAPSSLAVEFARESGQTLAGFVRGTSMNIYSVPGRIVPKRQLR